MARQKESRSGKRQSRGGCRTRARRDNELSCGSCWSQTGSPDDTSVRLTHPDSNLPLQDLHGAADDTEGERQQMPTVGLHDVFRPVSGH